MKQSMWRAGAILARTFGLLGAIAPAGAEDISPAAKALAVRLDAFEVEKHWPAGVHIDWQTGDPDGRPEKSTGKHTHCSAFVASVAKQLGVYILRPPEHGQMLLANAQNEWLANEGAAQGWRHLKDAIEAERAANLGQLVVATYHNHHDNKPGHIAIVRPSGKSDEMIAAEGPDVIQAGEHNYTAVSAKTGFAGHPAAWRDHEIEYYAHDLDPTAR